MNIYIYRYMYINMKIDMGIDMKRNMNMKICVYLTMTQQLNRKRVKHNKSHDLVKSTGTYGV
jgi:hypothetical protein